MKTRLKILVLQHVPWEDLGLFQHFCEQMAIERRFVRLYEGEHIPFKELESRQYSAVICLGSPATAYKHETNPYYDDEIALFQLVRSLELPSFNICYSMQLFCIAHGGKVGPNPNGKEVGFFEVHPTPSCRLDPIFGPLGSFKTLQWHGDCVLKLPSDAVHLAYSEKTEYQIAVLDDIHYLVQGDGQAAHPSILMNWFQHDGVWACNGTDVSESSLLEVVIKDQSYFYEIYRQVFTNFTDLVKKKTVTRT